MCLRLIESSVTELPPGEPRRLFKNYGIPPRELEDFKKHFEAGHAVDLHFVWQPGYYKDFILGNFIVSDRPTGSIVTAVERTNQKIYRGIHLYETQEEAVSRLRAGGAGVCLEVEGYPEDFVVDGLFGRAPCCVYHRIKPVRIVAGREWNRLGYTTIEYVS